MTNCPHCDTPGEHAHSNIYTCSNASCGVTSFPDTDRPHCGDCGEPLAAIGMGYYQCNNPVCDNQHTDLTALQEL